MRERRGPTPILDRENMPVDFPVIHTAVTLLVMDRIGTPTWGWWVVGGLLVVLWAWSILRWLVTTHVDVFELIEYLQDKIGKATEEEW